MRIPDLDRPVRRRLPRELSRLGRTPAERAVLLLLGGVLAYAFGRWSVPGEGGHVTASAHDIPDTVRGIPRVVDGDTLDFNGLRVRLHGIDAFEHDQVCSRSDGSGFACGAAARDSLTKAIGNSPVACVKRDVDHYGRMVAVCRVGDRDLGAKVVLDGAALAYRRYSGDYIDEENVANATRSGAWDGSFDPPWEHRRRGRTEETR